MNDLRSPVHAKSRNMSNRKPWIVLATFLTVAVFAAALYSHSGASVQYLTTKIQRGAIHDVVDATGTINAVVNVQVGSQVSGTVQKLNVDFNSKVKRGDI